MVSIFTRALEEGDGGVGVVHLVDVVLDDRRHGIAVPVGQAGDGAQRVVELRVLAFVLVDAGEVEVEVDVVGRLGELVLHDLLALGGDARLADGGGEDLVGVVARVAGDGLVDHGLRIVEALLLEQQPHQGPDGVLQLAGQSARVMRRKYSSSFGRRRQW